MAMPQWFKSRSVLLVVILAAVLLEVISTIQYSYTRGIMEQELERRAYSELVVSVLNIEEVLAVAEVTAQSQRWHAERNLGNPDYMNYFCNLSNVLVYFVNCPYLFLSFFHHFIFKFF